MKIIKLVEMEKNVWTAELQGGDVVKIVCRDGQNPEDVLKESEPE